MSYPEAEARDWLLLPSDEEDVMTSACVGRPGLPSVNAEPETSNRRINAAEDSLSRGGRGGIWAALPHRWWRHLWWAGRPGGRPRCCRAEGWPAGGLANPRLAVLRRGPVPLPPPCCCTICFFLCCVFFFFPHMRKYMLMDSNRRKEGRAFQNKLPFYLPLNAS